MATFKLGAIVTEIAGSIGGTTFKRNGSTRVMMNKNNGSAYSRLLRNPALGYLGSIFKSWSFLDSATQLAWNNQALLFTFPDKFGTLRNLSGRQLYIKLSAQRYNYSDAEIDPATLDSTLIPFTIAYCHKVLGAGTMILRIDSNTSELLQYFVMAEISSSPLRSPTFVSRKVFTNVLISGSGETDIWYMFNQAFPYYTEQYNARVYVYQMNSSGFKSLQQSMDIVVAPS